MSQHIVRDLIGVLKGAQKVASEGVKLQENYAKHIWANSSIKSALDEVFDSKTKSSSPGTPFDEVAKESLQRVSMVFEGIKAFTGYLTKQETKEEEITLNEYNVLEFDPTKPLEGILGAEGSKKIDQKSSQFLELELSTAISENGFAGSVILKSTPHDDSKLRPVHKSKKPLIDLKPVKSSAEPSEKVVVSSSEKPAVGGQHTLRSVNTEGIGKTTKQPIPIKPDKFKQSLSETARERRVPSSRLGRLISFGGLAAGLGLGTVAEVARQTLGLNPTSSNVFITPSNAERIVSTLCKVRGAALKIGQLISIQDNSVIDPVLRQAFERVRQSADFMPQSQVERVLRTELGADWRSKFSEFNMSPFAAASIGQVHMAKLLDGTLVAVKIQYPGVAEGINSDIENLAAVMSLWNVFPEGLFLDNLVAVAKKELAWEVDYIREAECTRKFRKLLEPYQEYYVPRVIDELCTGKVLTSELIDGVPVDKCEQLDLDTKNTICRLVLQLCLRELFQWRYMQTDPNWSNFFYNADSKKLILLDFGATRSYDKDFMDKYIEIVKAGADNDRKRVLELSRDMGFLTGYESKAMENAHIDTVMILAEQFRRDVEAFDFGRQDATKRVTQLIPTILNHRLCPPPEEIYSLHRKEQGERKATTKNDTNEGWQRAGENMAYGQEVWGNEQNTSVSFISES